MIPRLCFLLGFLMILHYGHGIDYDYYFNPLRSKKILNCTSKDDKIDCQLKCSVGIGLCISSRCYCLSLKQKDNNKGYGNIAKVILKRRGNVQSSDDFEDYTVLTAKQNKRKQASEPVSEFLDPLLLDPKPLLRHHIAHFCPNLDIARTCIRTCMKEGKPAFCGKDHVCYCGHRYTNTHSDSSANASSVYSEFHDMYVKYFGPKYTQQIQV